MNVLLRLAHLDIVILAAAACVPVMERQTVRHHQLRRRRLLHQFWGLAVAQFVSDRQLVNAAVSLPPPARRPTLSYRPLHRSSWKRALLLTPSPLLSLRRSLLPPSARLLIN